MSEQYITRFRAGTLEQRRAALVKLGQSTDPRVIPLLEELGDREPDPALRRLAFRTADELRARKDSEISPPAANEPQPESTPPKAVQASTAIDPTQSQTILELVVLLVVFAFLYLVGFAIVHQAAEYLVNHEPSQMSFVQQTDLLYLASFGRQPLLSVLWGAGRIVIGIMLFMGFLSLLGAVMGSNNIWKTIHDLFFEWILFGAGLVLVSLCLPVLLISLNTTNYPPGPTLLAFTKLPLFALGGVAIGVLSWSVMIFVFNMTQGISYGFRYSLRFIIIVVCALIAWLVLFVLDHSLAYLGPGI